ncbi:hypothetical protein BJG92_02961 [Arthrobacter sp. SO5]|nr:hypothetical protein [Arthrobacter sp. SO5]
MKLRATFLLPALGIIVALAIVAALVPDLFRPMLLAMPVVVFAALGGLFLTERKRRRRSPN